MVIVTGSVDTNLIPTAAIGRQGTTAPSSILMGGGVLLPGTAFRPYALRVALRGNPLFGNGASEGERNYQGFRARWR